MFKFFLLLDLYNNIIIVFVEMDKINIKWFFNCIMELIVYVFNWYLFNCFSIFLEIYLFLIIWSELFFLFILI